MKNLDVITIGESMVVFNPMQDVSFVDSHLFMKQLAGAESNFSIGLSRLNHKVGWISRLSDDSLGHYVNHVLRGNGVDTSMVQFDEEYPTGLLIKERLVKDQTNVHYYRSNSAASVMNPSIIDVEYFLGAKILFITGITPALNFSCEETIYKAIETAKSLDMKIVFDPNIRYKLIGDDIERYKQMLNDIASKSDYFLPGEGEIAFLTENEDLEESINFYLEKNPELDVIVKLGARGCYFANTQEQFNVPGYKVKEIVDPIGAGDAFSAGLVSGLLEGKNIKQSLEQANLLGSILIQTNGDIEGFPFKKQLKEYQNFIDNPSKDEVNR